MPQSDPKKMIKKIGWTQNLFHNAFWRMHAYKVTIQYNARRQSQLMLAKYILKNANFLQSRTISSEREKTKLTQCPKAYATC